MQKQPHRALEKTADNRYWQNQFRTDDAEFEPPKEMESYEPPTLTAADLPDHHETARFDDRPFRKR